MPTFYTQPEIAFQTAEAMNPMRNASTFLYLRRLAEDRKLRKIQEEEAQLRLEELKKGIARQTAVEEAFRGGLAPSASPAGISPNVSALQAMAAPQSAPSLAPLTPVPVTPATGQATPAEGNEDWLVQGLANADPQLAFQVKIDLAKAKEDSAREWEKHQAQLREAGAKATKDELDVFIKQQDFMASAFGRAALAVKLAAPEHKANVYSSVLTRLTPFFPEEVKQLPPQYSPDLEPFLDQTIVQAQNVKDYFDREVQEKQEKRLAVGVTEPFPPAVAAQKKDIARAGREGRGGSSPAQLRIARTEVQGEVSLINRQENLLQTNPRAARDQGITAEYVAQEKARIQQKWDAVSDDYGLPRTILFPNSQQPGRPDENDPLGLWLGKTAGPLD